MFTNCIIDTSTLDFPESKLFILDSQVSFLVHHNMFSLTIHFQTFPPVSNHNLLGEDSPNQNPPFPGALKCTWIVCHDWRLIDDSPPTQLKELPIASQPHTLQKAEFIRETRVWSWIKQALLPFHTHTFGCKMELAFSPMHFILFWCPSCACGLCGFSGLFVSSSLRRWKLLQSLETLTFFFIFASSFFLGKWRLLHFFSGFI